MLVTLAPGAHRDNALQALQTVHTAASNLRSAGPQTAYSRLIAYLDWATNSSRLLHNQVSPATLDRLILTRRHQALFDGFGHLAGSSQEKVVNGMVDLEVSQRIADLEEAIHSLQLLRSKWDATTSAFLVLDTNFFIHHPDKLENVDFSTTFADLGNRHLHIVLPLVIVEELDNLKQSKDRHIRYRAGYTLAVLDSLLRAPGPAVLGKRAYVPPSSDGLAFDVSIEILFDPIGHSRLPVADDEIVSRAVALQSSAGGPVSLVTYDTAMSMRARHAGLETLKFRTDAGTGSEPAQ